MSLLWTRNYARIYGNQQLIVCPKFCRGYARHVPVPQTTRIGQGEYDHRRKALVDSLPEGSACLLIGAGLKYASNSVLYWPTQALWLIEVTLFVRIRISFISLVSMRGMPLQ